MEVEKIMRSLLNASYTSKTFHWILTITLYVVGGAPLVRGSFLLLLVNTEPNWG
jgi:hypothetical protein